MGTLVRFPQERVDYSFPPEALLGATIIVLPVVRIERDESHLSCEDTFSAMKDSFAQLHESLHESLHDRLVPDA